jgi:mono/diheme cytochrome c family protein
VSSGSRELLGIFTHLDALLQAIHRLRDAGYRDSGVFSPLPRHELEEALARGPSPVRLFTLVGAILGAATGFVLTIATSLHYPLITSGKPIVSIPPFLVIVFELTILFGALATILGMLLNIRLPRLRLQPDYDPRFSGDRFGLWVRCQGDQIDAAQRILHSCRAEEVSEVLLEENKPRSKRADRFILGVLVILLGVFVVLAYLLPRLPATSDMAHQPSIKPQEHPLPPAPNSVPVQGKERRMELLEASEHLQNPVQATAASLEHGKQLFQIYCVPCHGPNAKGKGLVAKKLGTPPDDLTKESAVEQTDGYVYTVIGQGGATMPPQAEGLSPRDRWDVVNFLRGLQRETGAR